MDLQEYRVILAPEVDEKLDEIYDYLSENFSEQVTQKKIEKILTALDSLCIFPERGFDADVKCGKKIEPPHQTRGITIKPDYIALYRIEGNVVRVGHLFHTRSDYMKLF